MWFCRHMSSLMTPVSFGGQGMTTPSSWLRGMDLNHLCVLKACKLLILHCAGKAKTAQVAFWQYTGGSKPALLVGRVVFCRAAVPFTAVDAQAFLVLRLNFDGAVMPIGPERRRLVRHRVLAAQLFLNGGERVGYFGDLGGQVRSPAGCFGNAFQGLVAVSAGAGRVVLMVYTETSARCAISMAFSRVTELALSLPSLNRMMTRRTGPACGCFSSLSRHA